MPACRLYLASVTDDGEIDDMEARALGATAVCSTFPVRSRVRHASLPMAYCSVRPCRMGIYPFRKNARSPLPKMCLKYQKRKGRPSSPFCLGIARANTLGLLASDTPTRFRRLANAAKLPAAVSKPVLSSIADSLRDQALADGQFPDPVKSTLKLKRGEHCRLRTKVTVSKPLGSFSTVCLKIGNEAVQADHTTRIPIPPSGVSPVGRGDLFVTDERLILRSGKKSVTTRLE